MIIAIGVLLCVIWMVGPTMKLWTVLKHGHPLARCPYMTSDIPAYELPARIEWRDCE